MHKYKEINGDLITLALEGAFEVIVHGCNCFCTMRSGIASEMMYHFNCSRYSLEQTAYKGDINKLGQIQYETHFVHLGSKIAFNPMAFAILKSDVRGACAPVDVVNAYTQYYHSGNNPGGKNEVNADYEAIKLCMRKINFLFKGKHIGMPKIGAGLAGGDWFYIERIIKQELKDCYVTVVLWERKNKAMAKSAS